MLDSVVCAPGFWRTSCDKSGESDIFLTTSIEEWRHADPVGSSTSLLCFCFYHHFAPTIQRFGPDPGLDGLDLEQTTTLQPAYGPLTLGDHAIYHTGRLAILRASFFSRFQRLGYTNPTISNCYGS